MVKEEDNLDGIGMGIDKNFFAKFLEGNTERCFPGINICERIQPLKLLLVEFELVLRRPIECNSLIGPSATSVMTSGSPTNRPESA